MDHAVAIPLKVVTIPVWWLREAAAARLSYPHRIVGQHAESLSQLQAHLGCRLKSQRFIQNPTIFTGMKIDHSQTLISAPLNDELHKLPGNTSSPELRIGVNIQDCGAAAFSIVSMAWPHTQQYGATS